MNIKLIGEYHGDINMLLEKIKCLELEVIALK